MTVKQWLLWCSFCVSVNSDDTDGDVMMLQNGKMMWVMMDCVMLLLGCNSCRAVIGRVIKSLDHQLPWAWLAAGEPARGEPLGGRTQSSMGRIRARETWRLLWLPSSTREFPAFHQLHTVTGGAKGRSWFSGLCSSGCPIRTSTQEECDYSTYENENYYGPWVWWRTGFDSSE